MASKFLVLAVALAFAQSSIAQGVSFEWVTVGDPGNPNDPLTGIPTGAQTPPNRGAVPYLYSISKYETTIGQYTAFLNAIAKSNPERARSLYDSYLGSLDTIRGIARVSLNGQDAYYVKNLSSISTGLVSNYLPITFVDYLDTVRFVNWLHNGQGDGNTETGAYTIGEGGQVTRSPDARYWIPTENEWYKAAYYDPSPAGPTDDYWLYPWQGDSAESGHGNYYVVRYYATQQVAFDPRYTYLSDVREGSSSYYGTVNQAGNVEEWTEGDAFSGGPHTRGGWWGTFSPSIPQTDAFRRMAAYAAQNAPAPESEGKGFRVATVANPPGGGLRNGDSIRYCPRAGYNSRMVGGIFEGSTDGSSFTVLHTITQIPPTGWTQVHVDFGRARYFRYRAPDGAHGNAAEIEFCRSGAKLIAAASGTAGSWSGKGNDTFRAALDGDTSTFFDAPQPNGAYIALDSGRGTQFGTPPGYDNLTVTDATGTGTYKSGDRVGIRAVGVPPGKYFAGWEGFTSLLDDPTSHDTLATIPGVGVDFWLTASYKDRIPGYSYLFVENGSGDGLYPIGTMVIVKANQDPEGLEFAGWSGDIAILSNPFLETTTATIPSMDTRIYASYSGTELADKIRFHPRRDYAHRMVGGVFEGTNGDPIAGPYTTIYTVTSKPAEGWSEVSVTLGDNHLSDPTQYKYLRYRGPNGSYGNLAEIEFYRGGVKVTGTPFGTPGSWSNNGSTFDKALDGDTNTFFDGPNPDGNYVGIADNAAVPFQTDRIRYYPREGLETLMVRGVFEGTNGDPTAGPYVKLAEIANPSPGWNWIIFSDRQVSDFRYLRYRGPDNSHSTVAEIEFYRQGVRATGIPFGTPGSQNNSGNSFEKALDNNTSTFFDAPIASGAYVGLDTSGSTPGDMIRFYPRSGFTERMVGGVFEGTRGDAMSGPYEAIYTIPSIPTFAWSEVPADLKDYRYLRYRGPNNSYGNVAEIEFYRDGVKLIGPGFGTPGSWNDQGNTLEKALDGNVSTFFDAPNPNGAHVGISTP